LRLGRLRSQHDLPIMTANELISGKWLSRYARTIFFAQDAFLFLASGLAIGWLAELFRKIDTDGSTELLAMAAIGLAAVAVSLTALSIFVSLVDSTYLRILDFVTKAGGIAGYLVQYLATALVGVLAVIVGIVGALIYPAVGQWTHATLLGLDAGLVVWAGWGLFLITVDVAAHGINRFKLAQDKLALNEPTLADVLNAKQVPSTTELVEPPSEDGLV
jgi:hypothetical protein